jgi:serine/threonine-protein kinase RsbW
VLTDCSTIRLELASKPPSVAIVRGMISAVLEPLGFEAELLDDVKMAVSEACNNVVLHAYAEGLGPLLVELELADTIGVTVRDHGIGIAEISQATGRLGVGMPMMQTLAERAVFCAADGGGTEVRLEFRSDPSARATFRPSTMARPPGVVPKIAGDVVVTGCPLPLLATVMGRLATILAAEARFTVDRLSDLRLLTDVVAARAEQALEQPIGFALAKALRRLELALGPLDPGAGERLLSDHGPLSTGALSLGLADEWGTERLDGYEALKVVITESGPTRSTRLERLP